MKTSFFSFRMPSSITLPLLGLKSQRFDSLSFKRSKSPLLMTTMLLLAIGFVSCSGEDGDIGPEGPEGPQGVAGADGLDGADGISCWDLNGNGIGDITEDDANEDINLDGVVDALDCQGMDGEDGQDGADGNANVKLYKYNLDVFLDYTNFNLSMTGYIEDDLEDYAYLFYIDHKSGLRYPIPGSLYGNNSYARIYPDFQVGRLYVFFYDKNDTPVEIPGGEYTHLVMVAMKLSNTAKNGGNPMTELKAAGVDTSDYNAVADYFGLEQ
ncbi:collagen-like protein [Pseudozobellia thermophila]|uniref:Collagen triple helix repeat-containing protein n=1 Tax=Pseudozobellia thermophila TaxID=192903 RepID=A0A1M6AC67_9FLAO|nr:collagen-like protein [Pseudozobellia thermophila]SHI34092.1 hypothetical protein SAMN04488513_1016 [Pseudozobellia thermophila]